MYVCCILSLVEYYLSGAWRSLGISRQRIAKKLMCITKPHSWPSWTGCPARVLGGTGGPLAPVMRLMQRCACMFHCCQRASFVYFTVASGCQVLGGVRRVPGARGGLGAQHRPGDPAGARHFCAPRAQLGPRRRNPAGRCRARHAAQPRPGVGAMFRVS